MVLIKVGNDSDAGFEEVPDVIGADWRDGFAVSLKTLVDGLVESGVRGEGDEKKKKGKHCFHRERVR